MRHPIAVSADVDDVTMVDQPIDQRRRRFGAAPQLIALSGEAICVHHSRPDACGPMCLTMKRYTGTKAPDILRHSGFSAGIAHL